MITKLLVIDDDAKLTALMEAYLGRLGYEVLTANHPEEGLQLLRRSDPALIILDVMMPGMDGFEVCRTIRKEGSTPIIMLSARGEVTDRIVGLELGADDYLPKPFEPRELVARIEAILRRGRGTLTEEVIQTGPLRVDFRKHSVELGGQPILLTTAEFALLKLLIEQRGRVLSRDYMVEHLRGIEAHALDRSVDVLVSRVRQKLGEDPQNPHFIRTVRGVGYMFIAPDTNED